MPRNVGKQPADQSRNISNLTQFFKKLRVGDVVYIDVDVLLLREHNAKAEARLTEENLAEEIKRLQAAGIQVCGVSPVVAEVEAARLMQVGIELDHILPAPQPVGEQKPKRVAIVRPIEDQFDKDEPDKVKEVFSNITLVTAHYARPQKQLEVKRDDANSFPTTLQGFDIARSLGGGTESVFLIEDADEKQLVLKLAVHPNAMKAELLCNALYRVLGVPVPDFAVYKTLPDEVADALKLSTQHGMFQCAEFIDGEVDEDKNNVFIRQNLLALLLMGNIDIRNNQNFIVGKDGRVYLIDAGANFMFRGHGEKREEDADLFTELDHLGDPHYQRGRLAAFGDMSQSDLTAQAHAIVAKRAELADAIWSVSAQLDLPSSLRDQILTSFARRFDHLADRYHIAEQTQALEDKTSAPEVTAAGVLTYTWIEGKAHVLLSKRDDTGTWDNFGGKSDLGDEVVRVSARREVREESSEILRYTEAELAKSPFHDLVERKDDDSVFTYRMYLTEHAHFDTNRIRDHEHTEHAWVPVASILQGLEAAPVTSDKEETRRIDLPGDKEGVVLFSPLWRMLNQQPVLNNLKQLARKKPLKKTHTRGYHGAPSTEHGSQRVIETPKMRREALAQSLVAKSEVVRDLKKSAKQAVKATDKKSMKQPAGGEGVSLSTTSEAAGSTDTTKNKKLSPTELHMKNELKDKWVDKDVAANVTLMLNTHFRYDYNALSSDEKHRLVKTFVGMIENEKQNDDEQLYFYHACDENVAAAYEIYTELYKIIQSKNEWPVFRAKGGIFDKYLSIDAFMKAYQSSDGTIDNNMGDYHDYALSTNVFLFGSLFSSGSCTMRYMFENLTARNFDLTAAVESLLAPFDVDPDLINDLVALRRHRGAPRGGVLYQIGMPKDRARKKSYASRVGGVKKPRHDTVSLPDILDDLRSKEKLTDKDGEYVTSLQARVLVKPTELLEVTSTRADTMSSADQKAYVAERKRLMTSLAHEVVRNLDARNRDTLHSDVALVRMQKEVAEQIDLSTDYNATPSDLAKAVVASDSSRVSYILNLHPEWLEMNLVLPQNQAYVGGFYRSAEQKMSVKEMIIYHSDLPPQICSQALGDHWWEASDISYGDARSFARVLLKIPATARAKFADLRIEIVQDINDLIAVLASLAEEDRLDFLAANNRKLVPRSAKAYAELIKLLPEAARLRFAEKHEDLVKGRSSFTSYLEALPENMRLKFALSNDDFKQIIASFDMKHPPCDLIALIPPNDRLTFIRELGDPSFAQGLVEVLNLLPESAWKVYAKEQLDKDMSSKYAIRDVIKYLPAKDELKFISLCADKFRRRFSHPNYIVAEFSLENRLTVAKLYQDEIADSDMLEDMLALLPDDQQAAFKQEQEERLQKLTDFCDAIGRLPENERLTFVRSQPEQVRCLPHVLLVLPHLNDADKIAYVQEQKSKILYDHDLVTVLKALPEQARVALANELRDKFVNNDYYWVQILETIPLRERAAFVQLQGYKPPYLANFRDTLKLLPEGDRAAFIKEHESFLDEKADMYYMEKFLCEIVDDLPLPVGLKLLEKYIDKVNTPTDIIGAVRSENRLPYATLFNDKIAIGYGSGTDVLGLLQGKDIVTFAEQHMEKLKYADVSYFIAVVLLIPDEYREDFACKNEALVKRFSSLRRVVKALPETCRLAFALRFKDKNLADKHQNTTIIHVAEQLPESDRLALFDAWANDEELATTISTAMALLPKTERLGFAKKYRDKIDFAHFYDMREIFEELSPNEYLDFARHLTPLFRSGVDVGNIVRHLEKADKLTFISENDAVITSANDVAAIVEWLNKENSKTFLTAHRHLITSIDDVTTVASHLNRYHGIDQDAEAFLTDHANLLTNANDVIAVARALSDNTTLSYTREKFLIDHIDKITTKADLNSARGLVGFYSRVRVQKAYNAYHNIFAEAGRGLMRLFAPKPNASTSSASGNKAKSSVAQGKEAACDDDEKRSSKFK